MWPQILWMLQQLDAMEEGKDFVILPTGEKYPVGERPLSAKADVQN
jgi:hypothetical protein